MTDAANNTPPDPKAANSTASAPAPTGADPAASAAAAAAAATGAASAGAADAAGTADWRKALPADLAGDATLKRYKDLPSLAKGMVELNKALGRTGVRVPQEGDGPEIQAQFRAAMGVPEKPEDYALAPPEGFPADKWDKEGEAEYRKAAHELGLPPAAAKKLLDMFAQRQAKVYEGIAQAQAAATENLKKVWGADYEAMTAHADAAVEAYARQAGFTDDDFKTLHGTGLGEKMMRLLASFGSEGQAARGPGARAGSAAAMGFEAAQKRLAELRAGGAIFDKLHPDHDKAMVEYDRLIAVKQ